jgi:hypothetical protein
MIDENPSEWFQQQPSYEILFIRTRSSTVEFMNLDNSEALPFNSSEIPPEF